MKIGIITMHRVTNFGSALQAYALQEVVKNNGYEVEIIDYQYPNKMHLQKEDIKLQGIIKKIIKKTCFLMLKVIFGTSKNKVNKFVKNNLNLSEYYETYESIKNNPPKYDIYITGSDQVWNPRFSFKDDIFMLSFVNNKNKISYAPSVSVTQIDDNYKEQLKKYLSEYKYISVRELSSKKILENILEKDVSLVCDPTLLLSKNEWQNIGKKSKIKIKQKYVLFYILTYSYNPYPKLQEFIDKFVKDTGLYPVFLKGLYKKAIMGNGKYFFRVGPEDFISLIDNAAFVVTTSFHGLCFSVKLQKQFYALAKSATYVLDERLLSLMRTLGVENRLLYENENYEIKDKMYIDYENGVNQNLKKYVDDSYLFLTKALSNVINEKESVVE